MFAAAVAEPEAISLATSLRRLQRVLEPGVLVAAVVRHDVHQDADVAVVGMRHESVEGGQIAVHGLDVEIVGDVVAVIVLRRGVTRRQPHSIHTELLQVVEVGDDPLEIAAAVTVGVAEGTHIDLVHDGVDPPRSLRHVAPSLSG
jgi:hypothetical protein